MKKYYCGITILSVLFGNYAFAETLSFAAVWNKINQDSMAQESSKLQTEAFAESQARASRHWLPRVYLDATSYQTNDPGASFFGLLEQRSVQSADFTPDTLNHPDPHLYTKGALGVDLALYEGGAKSTQVDLFRHSAAAQKNTTSQIQLEQYAQVGLSYGSIAVLELQRDRLVNLNSEIGRMIKGYQLGSKSNPVGYSGLLGMKAVANRLSAVIKGSEAQTRSHYAILKEMGLKDQSWSPQSSDSRSFVDLYFSGEPSAAEAHSSFKVEAIRENVKVSEEMANMEKSKFLPRVGAFAEGFTFSGNRGSATGYNAGLYLQWSLFDPSAYGSLREARLKSMAAAKSSEASEQQERSERAVLVESVRSLRENIDLLNESYKILIEQSKMTETLFRNGSINALQIVEVLNRRADLIIQQAEVEMGLIKMSSQLITKQKLDIAERLAAGVNNEKY